MALSRSDKSLIWVLLAVSVFGIAVLAAGLPLFRMVSRSFAPPETTDPPPSLEWEKTFLRGEGGRGAWVEETADGGFIIAARVSRSGSRDGDWAQNIHLLKTDSGGSLEWEAEITINNRSNPIKVRQTADGGYIVIGNTMIEGDAGRETPEEEKEAVVLLKTDGDGSAEWEKVLPGERARRAVTGLQTDDGGYIVLGTIESEVFAELYLLKTDAAGEMEWEYIHAAGEADPELLESGRIIYVAAPQYVAETPGGGYVVVGRGSFGRPKNDMYMFIIDRDGNLRQEIIVDLGDAPPFGDTAAPASDGGSIFAVAEGTGFLSFLLGSSVNLVKTDASGNREWKNEYRRIRSVSSVRQVGDGGYLLLADSFDFFPVPGSKMELLRTDAAGKLQWVKTFAGESEEPFLAYIGSMAAQTSDGGFIVTGMYDHSIFLIKVMPENKRHGT